MPIYEPDLSFEDMKKATDTFKCAECGSILVMAWSALNNCYMVRCGQVLEHEGVVPQGRDPAILAIANLVRGRPLPMETKALAKLTPQQMIQRVNQARFPRDLTIEDRQLMAKVAIDYGLDPLFDELMIYQGRPYVTIDARRRKAQETDELDGINARPATKEEKEARRVPDEDYLFLCQVWRKGRSHPFEGWGRVTKTEVDRAIAQAKSHGRQEDALPIVKDPAAQAEKRAEAQGLRRGFHLPLPSFEEVIEGEFSEVSEKKEATKPKSSATKSPPSATTPGKTGLLTEPQRRKIWGDADKMGYSEDEVHEIVKATFEVESVNDLTIAQASTLIDMIAKGEGIPAKTPEEGAE